jgi:hypothetical protein
VLCPYFPLLSHKFLEEKVGVMVMSTVAANSTPAEKAAIVDLLALVSVAVAIWVTRWRGGGPQYT